MSLRPKVLSPPFRLILAALVEGGFSRRFFSPPSTISPGKSFFHTDGNDPGSFRNVLSADGAGVALIGTQLK